MMRKENERPLDDLQSMKGGKYYPLENEKRRKDVRQGDPDKEKTCRMGEI